MDAERETDKKLASDGDEKAVQHARWPELDEKLLPLLQQLEETGVLTVEIIKKHVHTRNMDHVSARHIDTGRPTDTYKDTVTPSETRCAADTSRQTYRQTERLTGRQDKVLTKRVTTRLTYRPINRVRILDRVLHYHPYLASLL